jgi:hypothetical protein
MLGTSHLVNFVVCCARSVASWLVTAAGLEPQPSLTSLHQSEQSCVQAPRRALEGQLKADLSRLQFIGLAVATSDTNR